MLTNDQGGYPVPDVDKVEVVGQVVDSVDVVNDHLTVLRHSIST